MANTFREVVEWVLTLPYWEQASFELLLKNEEISETDIDLLVSYLLSENDLFEGEVDKPKINIDNSVTNQNGCTSYDLRKISNLQNINALVKNQTLEFGTNLTAIFGMNGSGKSGYARVLGSAGFTRGDKEIIPNITQPYDPDLPQLATIEVDCGEEVLTFEYEIGKACAQLSSFYVFDSTSVNVHLTKENSVSFSPSGLSYLPELADLTDRVRERLQHYIESRVEDNKFVTLFSGDSIIKTEIENLNHSTDIGQLKGLAVITDKDTVEINQVKTKIATIETQGISAKVEKINKDKEDLKSLITQLDKISKLVCQSSLEVFNKSIEELNTCIQNANSLGLEEFKSGNLESVGSDEWISFIQSAKIFADKEFTGKDNVYPTETDHCLLCQQPLSPMARDLLHKLWKYLGSEIQKDLQKANRKLEEKLKELEDLDIQIFTEKHLVYRIIEDRNPGLLVFISEYLGKLGFLFQEVKKSIETRQLITEMDIEEGYKPRLQDLISEIDQEINKWQCEEGELEKYQAQVLLYEHKRILSTNISNIESYINNLQWIDKASKIGGSTSHITRTYNRLFSNLVTDEYIKLFEKTLEALGRPIKVRIDTRGVKGEVFKHLALLIHETTPEKLSNPDKILSEGEKRAVALADFLTEVTLDKSSRGIILDDPVTSLDIEWRQKIAQLLVHKAAERQVIVFTHDLPFLYFLCKIAEDEKVPIENHWIKRGDQDNIPGYVFLNNSPALEKDYKNRQKAMDCYTRALESSPEDQQSILREGFGALRTSYEALIIFEVFSGVVMRFEERISFARLREVAWDPDIAEEIISKCELCSRYIEGHLHSDTFGAEIPTPDVLLREITEYDSIKTRVKEIKKKSKRNHKFL